MNLITPLNVLIVFFIVLFCYLVHFLCLRQYLVHRRLRGAGIPCMPFIPLLGHLPAWNRSFHEGTQYEWFRSCVEQYGPIHVYNLAILYPRIVVSDPEYLADIYAQHTKYIKSDIMHIVLGPILGSQSLLLVEGKEHSYHRKMIAPAFHYANLISMIDIMVILAGRSVQSWIDRHSKSTTETSSTSVKSFTVEMVDAMSQTTLNILLSCVFGVDTSSENKSAIKTIDSDSTSAIRRAENASLPGNLVAASQQMLHRLTKGYVLPGINALPLPSKIKMDYHLSELKRVVDNVIEDRRQGKSHSNCKGVDLLDQLLAVKDGDTGSAFTSKQIRDESLTFVVAGHDTTTNLMCWTMYVLANHPEVMKDLRAENDAVLKGKPPTAADLNLLVVCEAVIQEVLRLYPPSPMVVKQCLEENVIGKSTPKPITIPVGVEIQVNILTVHIDPKYWGPNPLEFNYKQWMRLPDGRKPPLPHPFAYLPFSAGNRGCIGLNFATLEVKAILSTLVQRLNISMVPGQRIAREMILGTKPKYGLYMECTPRPEINGETVQ